MNPTRLSIARRKRGLTKKALAERADMGARTITAYERGEIEASPEATSRLAVALNFPVAFLVDEDDLDEPHVEGATFRSLSRMTARQRDSALASGALGFHLADWIEEGFNLPRTDIPDLGSMNDPEKAADRLRVEWGLGWGPIPSMVQLLESKGVLILSLSGCAREIDAFSIWNGERPFVLLNPSSTAERSRMDCAHELCHLALHRHQSPKKRDVEHEAKVFAGAFLMPKDGVLPTVRRNPSFPSVLKDKRTWRVSALAYVVRLHRLNLITDWSYRSHCIRLSKYGQNEANGIPGEQSVLLNKILEALRDDGVSRRRLAGELSLSPDDLNDLFRGLVMTGVRGGGAGTGGGSRPNLRLVE